MTSKHRRRRAVRRAHHQRTARDTNRAVRQGLTLEQYRLVQRGTPVEWAKQFVPGEPTLTQLWRLDEPVGGWKVAYSIHDAGWDDLWQLYHPSRVRVTINGAGCGYSRNLDC